MFRTVLVALCLLGLAATAAPASILYDNGPLVTNPGAGYGGHDVSALQSSLGESTYGYGLQVSASNRLADDFTIADPDGWDINSFNFFAYQTGSTTGPTIASLDFRIWDGVPDAPGSHVLFGDVSTNRLGAAGWSGIYRTTDADLLATTRPIMEVVGMSHLTLGPGTYWVDWQMDGDPALGGPWGPPTTYLGLTHQAWADARQYTTGSGWAAIQDLGSNTPDDLPFQVLGSKHGVVPEPRPMALFVLGLSLAGAALWRRR